MRPLTRENGVTFFHFEALRLYSHRLKKLRSGQKRRGAARLGRMLLAGAPARTSPPVSRDQPAEHGSGGVQVPPEQPDPFQDEEISHLPANTDDTSRLAEATVREYEGRLVGQGFELDDSDIGRGVRARLVSRLQTMFREKAANS
jgi:hypothetical protein